MENGILSDIISVPTNERIKTLLKYLNSGLYEKEEALRLALLCAIAGESIFFLGPPGTAKSMISRRIQKAFKDDVEYFEYLMNEFSTPDEIFGTIKLEGLDKGEYERNTKGYLPSAHVAFLDEIWKSGPAILNTLLTIINEKKFHNGNKIDQVPLQTLVAASNELPKENAGLEALYDRFIVRTIVDRVKDEDAFFNLCEKSDKELSPANDRIKNALLSIDEVKSWQEQIIKIALDDNIKEIITEIRKEMERKNQDEKREEKEKFYVSDRRWKKIIYLLKTSAFLCGRDSVDLMDCQLITYCIWNTAKQRDEVKKIVEEIVSLYGLDFTTAITDIEDQIDDFEDYVSETFFEPLSGNAQKKAAQEQAAETVAATVAAILVQKQAAQNTQNNSNLVPKEYTMNDGHKAYKFVEPEHIDSDGYGSYDSYKTVYFISLEEVYSATTNNYGRLQKQKFGAFYDDNCDVIGDEDFSFPLDEVTISDGEIEFTYYTERFSGRNSSGETYNAQIELEPQKTTMPQQNSTQQQTSKKKHQKQLPTQKKEEIFADPNVLEPVQEDADRKYKKIWDEIEKEKKGLEKFTAQVEKPFNENLFADRKFINIISAKLNEERTKLEDAKVELDKQRNRYIDTPYSDPTMRQLKRTAGNALNTATEAIKGLFNGK